MEFTKQTVELNTSRTTSACAMVTGSNGEKLVVVAGGYSSGMEVWNPIDGSVNILTPDFPLATGAGLPQMISIKNGRELIFYEAAEKPESERNGIWKYDVATNTWTKIGEMKIARNDFVVLPVDDISCP
jgi:hypothetical protein